MQGDKGSTPGGCADAKTEADREPQHGVKWLTRGEQSFLAAKSLLHCTTLEGVVKGS